MSCLDWESKWVRPSITTRLDMVGSLMSDFGSLGGNKSIYGPYG